jgi:hypothetical protein
MIIVVVVCFIKTLAVLKEVKKKRIDSTYMFWFKGNDDDSKRFKGKRTTTRLSRNSPVLCAGGVLFSV